MNNETNESTITSTIVPEMTYDQKMNFLLEVRKQCGLEEVETDPYTNESPKGKYLEVYGVGTI